MTFISSTKLAKSLNDRSYVRLPSTIQRWPRPKAREILPGLFLSSVIAGTAFAIRQLPGMATFSSMILSMMIGNAFHRIVGTAAWAKQGVTSSLRWLPTFPATSVDPPVLYTEVLARWAAIRRHRRLSSRWKSFRSEKPSVAPPSNRPAPSSLHDSTRLQIGSHPRKSPLAPVLRRSVLANPS